MTSPRRRALAAFVTTLSLAAVSCADPVAVGAGDADGADLQVVATTSIVGDVVADVVGDAGTVEVLMGPGADPHTFSPSAAQAAAVRDADVVVAIGLGLEESLIDLLASARADGVEIVELAELVETIPVREGFAHDHAGETEEEHAEHADEEGVEHGGEHGDEQGSPDPHIWFDPTRVAAAVEALAPVLAEVTATAADGIDERAAAVAEQLRALDAELQQILSVIPRERRVLVTNHDALGYLADRYDLQLVGTVVPGGATLASASAERLAELAGIVRDVGVPAIFAENTADDRLARSLAREVGADVEVVSLFTDALGPEGSGAETYAGMLRTDAQLIADALTR